MESSLGANEPHVTVVYESNWLINVSFLTPVYFQNDRYTVGGKEGFWQFGRPCGAFQTHWHEELSGTMVYLKQVKNILIIMTNVLNVKQAVQQKH